ncbi:hypothetical protein TNCV_398341 [Trichonephila clavipes]|nr:hypothetical protein TNCV_398341 [Trichonephila clavipes]
MDRHDAENQQRPCRLIVRHCLAWAKINSLFRFASRQSSLRGRCDDWESTYWVPHFNFRGMVYGAVTNRAVLRGTLNLSKLHGGVVWKLAEGNPGSGVSQLRSPLTVDQ